MANKELFRSRALSRSLKYTPYRSLVRPVVAYGSETLVPNKGDELSLLAMEQHTLTDRELTIELVKKKLVG